MTSSELLHVKRAPTRLCECCELLLECLVSFLSLLFDSFVRFCVYFKTSSTRREARLPTDEKQKKSTVGEISSLRLWLCFRAVDGLVSLFFSRPWLMMLICWSFALCVWVSTFDLQHRQSPQITRFMARTYRKQLRPKNRFTARNPSRLGRVNIRRSLGALHSISCPK